MYALLRSIIGAIGGVGGGAFKIANARTGPRWIPEKGNSFDICQTVGKMCYIDTRGRTRLKCDPFVWQRQMRTTGWLVGWSLSLCLRVRILRSVLFGYWTLLGCIGHCASVCCSPLKRSVQAYKHKRVRVCVRYFVWDDLFVSK